VLGCGASYQKQNKIKHKWYLQWWDADSGFKQKTFSGSDHLQGHQKLHRPPNFTIGKCCLEMPQKYGKDRSKGLQIYHVFPCFVWEHPN
jgi:hypothetical protein